MSDPRYKGGVLMGILLSQTPGAWPDSLPGLGDRRGGQELGHCARCHPGAVPAAYVTFVKYGETYMCKKHAVALASTKRLPGLEEEG